MSIVGCWNASASYNSLTAKQTIFIDSQPVDAPILFLSSGSPGVLTIQSCQLHHSYDKVSCHVGEHKGPNSHQTTPKQPFRVLTIQFCRLHHSFDKMSHVGEHEPNSCQIT